MEYLLQGYPENLYAQQVTIAAGASESEAVPTQGHALVAVVMPAVWTAANIAPKAGVSPTALQFVGGDTVQQVAKALAARIVPFPTDAVFGPFLSIASVDDTGAAVNQVADRVLILLFRRYLS